MDKMVIDAQKRERFGKREAARLRKSGKLPAVMYNESGENVALQVDDAQFNKVWRSITKTTLITLNLDGKSCDAYIRDAEYDIKTDKVLHADFWVVENKKPITFRFKVQYSGTPAGVLKGGFMVKHVPTVVLKALPKDMPERLVIDVSGVNVGEKFCVKDLSLGENVTVLNDAEDLLVSVAPAR